MVLTKLFFYLWRTGLFEFDFEDTVFVCGVKDVWNDFFREI